jgi:hypothetical protein
MKRIFYVHWHEAELRERIQPLLAAGYEVLAHSDTGNTAKIAEPYPDAFVISLDRLPSHGRAIAEWVWEAKKRQHLPIIFAGGQPEKVAATKAKFPRARFCGNEEVLGVLQQLQPRYGTGSESATALS